MSGRPKRSTRSQAAPAEASPAAERESRDRNKRTQKKKRKREDSEDNFTNPDSDDEFERLMELAEKEEDERIAKKKRKKEDKLQKEQQFQEDHQDFCEVCKAGGEILLCDGCPKAYHKICLEPELDEVPDGAWYCPCCVEGGIPEKTEEETTKKPKAPTNMDTCLVCTNPGFLLLCSSCPKSFHAYCLTPALEELPDEEDEWNCPWCTIDELPLKPHKIISWRWVNVPYPDPCAPEDALKEGENEKEIDPERRKKLMLRPQKALAPRKERELFIKWKTLSYYHSTWENELPLLVHNKTFVFFYWQRNNDQEPPEMEDGSTDAETGEVADQDKDESDLNNLEKRFYRYGVKPEWMTINRIINHHKHGGNFDYYIKWCTLGYDHCTWEADDMNIPDMMQHVNKYWTHRELMSGEKIPKSIERKINAWREENELTLLDEERQTRKDKAKKKYDISKKYEDQPHFVLETGGKLHEYQMEGINWLRHCWDQNIDAILADEMGLGKTVQSMTFLYSLFKEGHCKGPFLIAAPLSTIINWEREAEFWAPDFYVVTYVGEKNSRAVIREHEITYDDIRNSAKATRLRSNDNLKFHVLLTSYECINVDKAILSSIKWEALVVDEAHRLKNSQSLFFRNLREYDINYKLLLTGTPLQNNLEELFHLLNFLSPDEFDNIEQFTDEFADISKEDQVSKLHSMLGPHMLRRMKADVLTGMPSKSELIVCVDMAPLQRKYYRNILTRNFEALNIKGGGKSVSLTNILMELKKCCNHPYLFPKASIEAPKTKTGAYEGEALIKGSAKCELLAKMLIKLKAGGHRVLIFSQMTKLLDILEEFLEHMGYKYERIDGSITGQLRQESIDRFNAPNSEHFVFLLSTRAGGLGINLATADTVIIYDSDWNPHNDIQAFSRAHRIGQRNHVMIYRFVTRNSVEERITTVAKKKMLLTHLVVRTNNAKSQAMSKSELDDVLRWGTEELFKEEEEDDKNKIVWDDESVDALLHRATEADKETGEKKDWANDYLSSFKVAQYVTKEKDEKEIDPEEAAEIIKEAAPETTDPDYWERLLRHHYEQDQEVEAQQLGKGKRVRRQVNYAAETMHSAINKKQQPDDDDDYNASDDNESGESGQATDEEGENPEGGKKKKKEIDEKLPPLLARVGGQLEVLGFNPRQRRAFYNAIMRHGMPPPDSYNSQWLVRDLRMKSEKTFKAYCSLFMRHLCEPGSDHSDHFNDGVPREGLNRQLVLSRIGVMQVIRRKVQEFQENNGVWSMPEEADRQLAACLDRIGIIEDEESQSKEPSAVPEDKEKEKSATPAEENGNHQEMEVDTSAEKKDKKRESKENGVDDSERKRPVSDFKFNICDGGFTQLHTIWKNENDVVQRDGLEYEMWNRRHDYWLLAGITVHGYGLYSLIMKDPRFSIIKEGFKCDEDRPNHNEIMLKFLQRRFKLLEQALIIEEQLRRATMLTYGQKPPVEEKKANGETPAVNGTATVANGESSEVHGEVNGNGESSKNPAEAMETEEKEKSSTPVEKAEAKPATEKPIELEKKYVQINTLIDANQALAKEAFAGNKAAATALIKYLSQFEDILNDMKADVSRLPATVAQLPVVSERLELSERSILNRLTTRDTEATAGVSPLPPPGPFVTEVIGTRFTGLQPKFSVLASRQAPKTPSFGLPVIVPLDDKPKLAVKPQTHNSSPAPSNDAPPTLQPATKEEPSQSEKSDEKPELKENGANGVSESAKEDSEPPKLNGAEKSPVKEEAMQVEDSSTTEKVVDENEEKMETIEN